MLKSEHSMAFTTDGLDCHDSEKSAVYSFCIHYYQKNELRSEVLFEMKVDEFLVLMIVLNCCCNTMKSSCIADYFPFFLF